MGDQEQKFYNFPVDLFICGQAVSLLFVHVFGELSGSIPSPFPGPHLHYYPPPSSFAEKFPHMAFVLANSAVGAWRSPLTPSSTTTRRPARRTRWTASAIPTAQVEAYRHYLVEIAKVEPPPYLDALLYTLSESGAELVRPSERTQLHPFVIPLAYDARAGRTTGLLRWPTPPVDMDLPVVTSAPGAACVTLSAPSAKAAVTRAVASADYAGDARRRDAIRNASSLALAYQDGEVDSSGLGLERFVTVSVGGFPDLYEGLARFHLAKGDISSALVTCERASECSPGWARAHAFHADILMEVGREVEARDAARFSLTLPLWTTGSVQRVRDMGKLAGYQDAESLGKIYRRLFEDERMEEIQGGKAPQQVALDRAAWLLDVFVAEEGFASDWDDVRERLAELYDSAGLEDMATFVRY